MSTTARHPNLYRTGLLRSDFEVKLRNRPLGQDVVRDITQVTYKDNVKEIDNFEITINNWDAEKRKFKYSDEDLFLPGETVELWMGYYGKDRLRLMIKGEITSLRPSFPTEGQPTLAISGLNLLHKLRGSRNRESTRTRTTARSRVRLGASPDSSGTQSTPGRRSRA